MHLVLPERAISGFNGHKTCHMRVSVNWSSSTCKLSPCNKTSKSSLCPGTFTSRARYCGRNKLRSPVVLASIERHDREELIAESQRIEARQRSVQETIWTALDVGATLGAVGGAVAFVLTEEVILVGLPVILPLVAFFASRQRERLRLEASTLCMGPTWPKDCVHIIRFPTRHCHLETIDLVWKVCITSPWVVHCKRCTFSCHSRNR